MFNRNNIICILTVGFGSFTSLLSSTTVEIAFPQMMGALALNLNQAQWTITLYMIVMTIAMLLAADIVKRLGVKTTFIISFVIMAFGSLIGGIADNLFTLLTGRFCQGFAAGLQAPLATIVLGQIFPKNRMGIAMGFFGAIMLLAPALGPVVGGYIIEITSWREIFYFQIPMAIISIYFAFFYLSNATQTTKDKYDWLGLFILSLLLSSFFLALHFIQKFGIYCAEVTIFTALFCLLAFIFYYCEEYAKQPLVKFSLFKDIIFTNNVIVIFALGVCMFSSILLIPIYLLEVKGYSARQAGEALLIPGLIMAVMAPISGWLSDKYPPRELILAGLIINGLAVYSLIQLETGSEIAFIVVAATVSRMGMSVMLPALYVSSLKRLDEDTLPYGASMINFSRQLGGALGVLLFSAMFERSKHITEQQVWLNLIPKLETQGFATQLETPELFNNFHQGVTVLSGHTAFREVFLFNTLMTVGCIILILLSYFKSPLSSIKYKHSMK